MLAGRLATYKYYNMDQIVGQALTVYAKMISIKRTQALVMRAGHAGNGNTHGKVASEGVLTQELALTPERGSFHGQARPAV